MVLPQVRYDKPVKGWCYEFSLLGLSWSFRNTAPDVGSDYRAQYPGTFPGEDGGAAVIPFGVCFEIDFPPQIQNSQKLFSVLSVALW